MTLASARIRRIVRSAGPFAFTATLGMVGPTQAQNLLMEQAVRECKAGCMETIRDVKDPGATCAHFCWCLFTDKVSQTVEESQERCAAEVRNRDDENLTQQQVNPAHLVYFEPVRPYAEDNRLLLHFNGEPRLKGAKLLSCTYGSVGVYFWYKKVPMTRKELLAVHARHPMRTLGDVALSSCPKTMTEAKKIAR